ncbi:hypothetical protein CEXT_431351 [Caerostris extrusa]|uniref:Uncharacterized protein n=1 Tax=Caerostris extrusa TaxID=172846 RepID=A0AAV4TPT5_CAEEX|nr:hypothetical protein CEXT_431351 [Caerostris extrusa]
MEHNKQLKFLCETLIGPREMSSIAEYGFFVLNDPINKLVMKISRSEDASLSKFIDSVIEFGKMSSSSSTFRPFQSDSACILTIIS